MSRRDNHNDSDDITRSGRSQSKVIRDDVLTESEVVAEWTGADESVELSAPDQFSPGESGLPEGKETPSWTPPTKFQDVLIDGGEQPSGYTFKKVQSVVIMDDDAQPAAESDDSVWDDTDIVHVVRESMLGDTATHEVGHVVGDGPDDSGDVQPAEGFSLNFTKIETVVAESGYQALPELDANANRTAGPTSAGVGAEAGASSQVYLGDIVISAISDDSMSIKSPRDVASGQATGAHDRYANQEVSYIQSDDGVDALLPFVEQDPLVMDHDLGGEPDLDGGLDL
ncbi:MAG: hypothetical protein Q7V57_14260 [Actinomycetota bacterium]|nr:hypothetical protein [Actinomycetota bacterium]